MYEPTFWRDHVTEFNDRFREQNNADGTITHVPIEGEIIQEGTPQNAANFNNIEMGIFAANEITAELMRVVLLGGIGTGGASGISKSVEISSNPTPAVGVKTHYYVIADVAGYIPQGFIPEGAADGYLQEESGEVARASISGDDGISPLALKFD